MSRRIRLLSMENISPLRSQTVYHAAGYAMKDDTPDTILLVSPGSPYVCVGCHQDMQKEVDLEYCSARGLPVYRREVGGGAVYLDNGQLFAQWVFHRENLPSSIEKRFAMYIEPLVATYRALGIDAVLRPINDVHVNGKKIGGTGAAQIGAAEVVVGSLMFTFDKNTMSRVLKVSSEKMRDKIYESLEEYMTTMTEQLGRTPERAEVKELYIRKVSDSLRAEVYEGEWTPEEEAAAAAVDERFVSEEWLRRKGLLRRPGVKIHHDVHVVEGVFKARGGLIRVVARLAGGMIDDVAITGDFTLMPSFALGALEQCLCGSIASPENIEQRLNEAYDRMNIESPGVTPADFSSAVMSAVSDSQR